MNGSAVDALVVAGTKLQTASRTRCYYPMNGKWAEFNLMKALWRVGYFGAHWAIEN